MDKNFEDTLRFLLTADSESILSTDELVAKLVEHFPSLTRAVARDALDLFCEGLDLEGSPKVSRRGGSVNSPLKDYPLRWRTDLELVKTAEVPIS